MFKRKRKKLSGTNSRFTAMSKLIGVFIALFVGVIILYALFEMHIQSDLSSLPQLFISIFGLSGVYIGFYLTMAKWEHIEQEKTIRQKELIRLKKKLDCYCEQQELEEEIEQCNCDIEDLNSKEKELESEEPDTNF